MGRIDIFLLIRKRPEPPLDAHHYPAANHRCGSSPSLRLCLQIGRRVITSRKYAYGSCPFSRADWIRLMIAVARCSPRSELANNQFERPIVHRWIWLSTWLLALRRCRGCARGLAAQQAVVDSPHSAAAAGHALALHQQPAMWSVCWPGVSHVAGDAHPVNPPRQASQPRLTNISTE